MGARQVEPGRGELQHNPPRYCNHSIELQQGVNQ